MSSQEHKVVSVIVPVYNTSQYLEECISSILRQSLYNIEVICVDDGSTDSSSKILDDYARKDSRIRVIHKKNTGYGNTMNIGMSAAEGKYLAIVESDDWIQPAMLETLVKLADHYELDWIKSDFARFKSREDAEPQIEINHLCSDERDYGRVFCPTEKAETFFGPMNTWSGIYRTEFIRKNKIVHNETPGASFQDNGFWFQTFAYAKRAMFYYQIFYMNRRDNESSSVYNPGNVYAMCREYDYIRSKIKELTDPPLILLKIYGYYRFSNYFATIRRIADEYKLEFIKKFREDYLNALELGEVDEEYFYNSMKKKIKSIILSPERFFEDYMNRKQILTELTGNAESIILYGAGIVGREAYQELCEFGWKDKISCFAVTETKGQIGYQEGIPVKNIDYLLSVMKDPVVLLTVKANSVNKEQMIAHLNRVNFKNYKIYIRQES